MSLQGIYTLANDVVFDQLVALLNSIEVNVSPTIPIYVIPFDHRLERVKTEINSRKSVTLFDSQESIQRWEAFVEEVWDYHPSAQKKSLSRPPWGKGHHRKFIAFDGPLEKFVYYDADSLAMKPLNAIFEKLDNYDFVFDDWEHRKPDQTAALNIELILKSGIYTTEQVRPQLHCSSFFGSQSGFFNTEELSALKERLIKDEEINWVARWWDDAFLFNYMTLRCNHSIYNFTQSLDGKERTGNCADADPFVNIDNVLYNQEGLKPIHRIHYMNYSSSGFTRLCQGEDADIRYKDVFLYYRFLKHPEQKPKDLKPPSSLQKATRKAQAWVKKFQKNFA